MNMSMRFLVLLSFMAWIILTLAFVGVRVASAQPQGQQCTFAWDQVATNADGTTIEDLAGYRLYMSMQSGVQVAVGPNACEAPSCYQFIVTDLADFENPKVIVSSCPDRSYWVATAFDTVGPLGTNESGFSNEVQVADRTAPPAPTGLRLELR